MDLDLVQKTAASVQKRPYTIHIIKFYSKLDLISLKIRIKLKNFDEIRIEKKYF